MKRRDIAARLRRAGIEEADEEAMRLFCRFSGMSRAAALADRDADCAAAALEAALSRRERREPLCYILGETDFYGETYRVSPACLIPRSDTECLVDIAIRALPRDSCFADFGTGSGCVAISVLAHRPDCRAHAYDISSAALALARENAARNGVADRITFFEKDLRMPGGVCREMPPGGYAAILSNPPYIESGVLPSLQPEVAAEPAAALDGGADGLLFYRCFLRDDAAALRPGGFFAFEIGYDQGRALENLAAVHGFSCQIFPDLGGRDRVAVLWRGEEIPPRGL